MIDIHTHILNDVDDGAQGIEESIEMLKEQEKQGVTDCILTPHFKRHGEEKQKLIENQFSKLLERTKQEGININLYLGKEVYYKEQILELEEQLCINKTPYVLVEFSTRVDPAIDDAIYNFKVLKLKPIIAHVERYEYLKKDDYSKLKRTGAMLQLNAAAINGTEGFKRKKLAKYLLKNELIDIIASDSHNMLKRRPNLLKAYNIVTKKYGRAYADKLFIDNPKKIIEAINQ